jgi:hypothetical protein
MGDGDITTFPPETSGTYAGNTGLDEGSIEPYPLGWNPEPGNTRVLDYLASLDYGVYNPEIWDCEDRAFWGVAHARHKFPGLAIGVASGKRKRGGKEEDHAVIILWDTDDDGHISKSSKYYFYDPDLIRIKSPKPPILEEETEFTLELIVPFPMSKTHSTQSIPPLDREEFKNPIENKHFIWDYKHNWSFKKNDVFAYLKDSGQKVRERYGNGCPEFADPQRKPETHKTNMTVLRTYWQNDIDSAAWAFTHARRQFMGCPIGFAYGRNNITQKNDAALIMWEDPDNFTYFHLEEGILAEKDFKPSIVWV